MNIYKNYGQRSVRSLLAPLRPSSLHPASSDLTKQLEQTTPVFHTDKIVKG
jgi:hypothetical protein